MPILREWRAEVRSNLIAEYVEHTRRTGLAHYLRTPGNLGALIAVREINAGRTEVMTVSLWSSWDAIRAFAGDDPEGARYYPEDDRFLLTRPKTVKHYETYGEGMTPRREDEIS